ncbi:MAG: DNA-binding protein [Candidatus Electryonea clarkiae]|nr:DNA-binding protein [Candidatus Electryonea clarkiae]MDP8285626.1 DNA-binding protein [Candidatus Electryonea clarkiae]
MNKNLTQSQIDRQNVLNNPYALKEIQNAVEIKGIKFENSYWVIREQVAAFFEIDIRTVNRYIGKYSDELTKNGYVVLRGKRLSTFMLAVEGQFGKDINVPTKTTRLGAFNFRAFLNIAMLLTESERARLLRQTILDIVIDTINIKSGGGTKYINQRDEDFIIAYFQEEDYRKEFTDALRDFVDMGNIKYPIYTNKIYLSIFRENAEEYRNILKLQANEKVRDTFYSEILDLISSYEYGFAKALEEAFYKVDRKLDSWEVDHLFSEFESQPHWKPLIERARQKMASRDLAFRDALHLQLKEYITPLQSDEFERFLGEKSKELAERLEEAKDVFKRLKERE